MLVIGMKLGFATKLQSQCSFILYRLLDTQFSNIHLHTYKITIYMQKAVWVVYGGVCAQCLHEQV